MQKGRVEAEACRKIWRLFMGMRVILQHLLQVDIVKRVLWCVAVCCGVLQCFAVFCSGLQCVWVCWLCCGVCCR